VKRVLVSFRDALRRADHVALASAFAAHEEAIDRFGAPGIFNSDHGSQVTSDAFLGVQRHHTIQISMDGRGCWRDNVFVERLWRSLESEDV
jgi:putative transposase